MWYLYDINVYLAVYILFAVNLAVIAKDNPNSNKIQNHVIANILNNYTDFVRAFSEYDISKEAMMLFSENLKSIVVYEISKCE